MKDNQYLIRKTDFPKLSNVWYTTIEIVNFDYFREIGLIAKTYIELLLTL